MVAVIVSRRDPHDHGAGPFNGEGEPSDSPEIRSPAFHNQVAGLRNAQDIAWIARGSLAREEREQKHRTGGSKGPSVPHRAFEFRRPSFGTFAPASAILGALPICSLAHLFLS
jgi:hypothetical protein